MEFMEHDLKVLMSNMKGHWSASEVKCLMKQLLEVRAFPSTLSCHLKPQVKI